MIQKEITDENILIAEFMGGEKTIEKERGKEYLSYNFARSGTGNFFTFCRVNHLDYECSWNSLMPVVEKIEKIQLPSPSMIPVSVQIKGSSCRIFKGEWNDDTEGFISVVSYSDDDKRFSKIEVVFRAIVEFIKWYNQQKQTTNG